MISSAIPPWIRDPATADCWVPVAWAAKHWFRRSTDRLTHLIRKGEFDGVFETWWDGKRMFIKLPEAPPRDSNQPEK